jgi:hypothetical protein
LLPNKFDMMRGAATVALCLVSRVAAAQEKPSQVPHNDKAVYVGLIEDDRRQLARLGSKDFDPVSNRTITPVFVRDASGWKPIQQLDQKITWTVAFDGKNLGQVESEPLLPSQARLDKVAGPSSTHSILTPADKIPAVGKAEGKFNGNFETVVRRPLVVVSRPNFNDPDGWKRGIVPDQVTALVRSSFRKVFSHIRQCDASREPLNTDWNFPDSEIVTAKAYSSKKKAFLVETELRHSRCVYDVNGNDLQSLGGNQWFYVAPNRQVMYLGNRWELVDAGDYDGNGESEVIFYLAEGKDDLVETEGYVLFYDDFRRNVRYTWND